MEKIKFIHKVSKGSRFNQIYIPKEMDMHFKAGDLVEVTLLKKRVSLYPSNNLKQLSEFKENLIKNIFSSLETFNEIKQIFIVGSFLTQKTEYNDIDLILISDKNLEEEVFVYLTDNFQLKFHIMVISEKSFQYLQKSCPLTRSMLYFFVSNKEFLLSEIIETDKKHLKFLLMMPEDLLTLKLKSRVFYDSVRRLITIERFLENKILNPILIEKEIANLLGEKPAIYLRSGEEIDEPTVKKLRDIIKIKLNNIYKKIK